MTQASRGYLRRQRLERHAPDRRAGMFYRAASDNPLVTGGVSLDSLEASAVAAVRLGYKVAEAQIERTTRLAQRIRDAGDRAAGPGSDRKALDATEQIVFKTILAGLSWLEGLAAEGGNPIQRLAATQFPLIGAALGLFQPDRAAAPVSSTDQRSTADRSVGASDRPAPTGARLRQLPLQVRHQSPAGSKTLGRAVRIVDWHLSADAGTSYRVMFYRNGSNHVVTGALSTPQSGVPVLTVRTSRSTPSGVYRAAICDDASIQIGYVEIEV
jgi:hypothetical protein